MNSHGLHNGIYPLSIVFKRNIFSISIVTAGGLDRKTVCINFFEGSSSWFDSVGFSSFVYHGEDRVLELTIFLTFLM